MTVDNVKDMMRLVGRDTLESIGRGLLRFHSAKRPDYRKRFGITEEEIKPRSADKAKTSVQSSSDGKEPKDAGERGFFCFRCKAPISEAEARFCFDRRERFGGRAFCREHQRSVPRHAKEREER